MVSKGSSPVTKLAADGRHEAHAGSSDLKMLKSDRFGGNFTEKEATSKVQLNVSKMA